MAKESKETTFLFEATGRLVESYFVEKCAATKRDIMEQLDVLASRPLNAAHSRQLATWREWLQVKGHEKTKLRKQLVAEKEKREKRLAAKKEQAELDAIAPRIEVRDKVQAPPIKLQRFLLDSCKELLFLLPDKGPVFVCAAMIVAANELTEIYNENMRELSMLFASIGADKKQTVERFTKMLMYCAGTTYSKQQIMDSWSECSEYALRLMVKILTRHYYSNDYAAK